MRTPGWRLAPAALLARAPLAAVTLSWVTLSWVTLSWVTLSWATIAIAALTWVPPASAAPFEPREFTTPEHERSYRKLIEELRCLVCQNQNVADSDADLAGDLRREVYEQLAGGATETEVLDFMTARYGDFVLYRPPFKATTVALWVGPFALVLVGGLLLVMRVRRRDRRGPDAAEAGLDEAARQRLAALTGVTGAESSERERR